MTNRNAPIGIAMIVCFCSFSGCQDASELCDEIECSGHGLCVVLDEEPTCSCDRGYVPDGLNCVRERTSSTYDSTTSSSDNEGTNNSSTSTNNAVEEPECTSDGQCRGRCVDEDCVECRTDDDCQSYGECYSVSQGGCLGASDCPYQLRRSYCSSNECICPDVSLPCGTQTCGWRFD